MVFIIFSQTLKQKPFTLKLGKPHAYHNPLLNFDLIWFNYYNRVSIIKLLNGHRGLFRSKNHSNQKFLLFGTPKIGLCYILLQQIHILMWFLNIWTYGWTQQLQYKELPATQLTTSLCCRVLCTILPSLKEMTWKLFSQLPHEIKKFSVGVCNIAKHCAPSSTFSAKGLPIFRAERTS